MALRETSRSPADAPRWRFGRVFGQVVVVALAIAASLALATPASAAPAQMAVTATADIVEPLTAEGCTGRNGPGNRNSSCVRVVGTGTYVETVRGWMSSFYYDLLPVTLCGVKVHVWGTYANGNRFERIGEAACSYYGNAYVNWTVNAHFRAGTSVCGRTLFKNEWGNPACIRISY